MLVLMGKTCSGKDTIRDILAMKYGFHPIVTYTTRPIRKGEINGVSYHYITTDEFLHKINNNFFIEWKSYDVNGNTWHYGTSVESITEANEKSVLILTPDGVRALKKQNISVTVVYVYSNLATIRSRLTKRKDNNDSIERRIQKDQIDFKNAYNLANRIVFNNVGDDLEDVVRNINAITYKPNEKGGD